MKKALQYIYKLLPLLWGLLCLIVGLKFSHASEKTLGLDLVASSSSNLYQMNDPDHNADSSLKLVPTLKLKTARPVVLSAQIEATRNLSNPYAENEIQDLRTSARMSALRLNPFLGFSPGISLVAGTSKSSVKNKTLIGSVILQPRMNYSLAKLNKPVLKNIAGFLQVSASRSLHQYDTARSGESNIVYGVTPIVEVNYSATEKLYLALDMSRSFGFTYAGGMSNTFDITEEIGYRLNKHVAIAVGHNNSGTAYKENGLDSNVSFSNGDSSTIYTSLILSI